MLVRAVPKGSRASSPSAPRYPQRQISEAMSAYRRASMLNPRDSELRLLASRRALVERLHREPDAVGPLIERVASR
jgi:hypothetical protein